MTNTKKIIGLTGNIATGKSVIRRMLANSSALGIDADEVAHRMLYPGGPAYESVIKAFGSKILENNQCISRQRLGEIVFKDPQKLAQLEALIHPGVIQSILLRIDEYEEELIVIEAIKLLESGLVDICDRIWVSDIPPQIQVKRLMEQRKLAKEEAFARVSAQPPQSEKRQQADVVINTEGSFKDTWQQVQSALNDTIQLKNESSNQYINIEEGWVAQPPNIIDLRTLEDFWSVHSGMASLNIYAYLGMNMVLPIFKDNQLCAMLIWDKYNFTATLTRVLPSAIAVEFPQIVLRAFEAHSRRKQCELLLIPENLSQDFALTLNKFNVQCQPIENLTYPAWKSAANRLNNNELVWAKVLLQPIESKGILGNINN